MHSHSKIMLLLLPISVHTAAFGKDTSEFIREALRNPNVKEVVIPAGSYTADRPIVMDRDGVSLRGEGEVTITLADHANSPLLVLGNIDTPPKPVHDLKVHNLTLRGNRENQDMECWGGACDTGGTTYIRNNGITIRGVHRAQITKVETTGFRSGGIVTEKVSSKLHIDGWVSKDNYFDGFAGYQTTDSLFENLDLSENLGAGISLDIHFHGNTFRKVRMYKNMDVGVFMRESNANIFQGLHIIDSGSHGVFVSQVDNLVGTVPINNVFEDLIVAGAKGNGFHLNHAAVGNKLINPRFSNIRGQDIFEAVPNSLKITAAQAKCKAAINRVSPEEQMMQEMLKKHREAMRNGLML